MSIDWKAEYLKSVESGCITLDELREARAELDATNRQVEILSDALAESRREVAALNAAQPAPVQEPVIAGSLSVRYFRGCKSMTNANFDYEGDLPEGDYTLYTTPPAAAVQEGRDWSLLEATQESLREHIAEIKRLKAAQPAPVQEPSFSEGWERRKVIGFDALVEALDYAERKGFMPDYIADAWEGFNYLVDEKHTPPAAQPAPVQDPVAWRWVNPKGWLTYGEEPHDTFKSTPLYTTPPAAQPAVPDAMTSADIQEHIEYVAGWNECRQAMLEMMK
jgi:hypothetical protein